VAEFGCTLGEELLKPTRIYAQTVMALLSHYKIKHVIHGIANITGGGLADNIGRLLPKGTQVRIRRGAWTPPLVFQVLARLGDVPEEEMYRVFNMGIGMAVIVPAYNASMALDLLRRNDEEAWVIGEVRGGNGGVVFGG
jgi:phosphoribosylformylglycinamidine cyclo-ligase